MSAAENDPARARLSIIVNGLPGAMGQQVSRACLARGLGLAPFALTGPNMPSSVTISATAAPVTIQLHDAATASGRQAFQSAVEALRKQQLTPVAIDFTHPSAVNSNADLYNSLHLPFVMGTTGGDRALLVSSTHAAKNHAVIAPNMCKQIVAFQAMMGFMAENYPGAFAGYTLTVQESHQKTKADTSGTAKAVVQSLSALVGKPVEEREIKKIRTDADSMSFGVPAEHLSGHAYHTYTLQSADKSVTFAFQHNVNGRSTYAEGVVDAVLFLADKLQAPGKVYDMISVLESGKMA